MLPDRGTFSDGYTRCGRDTGASFRLSSVPYLLNEVSLFTYSLKQLKHLKVLKRPLTVLLLSIPYQLKAFK